MDFGAIIKAGTGALGGVLSAALLPIAGPLAPVIGGAVGAIGGAIGDSVTAGAAKDAATAKAATNLVAKVPGIAPGGSLLSKVPVEALPKVTKGTTLAASGESNGLMYGIGALALLALLKRK